MIDIAATVEAQTERQQRKDADRERAIAAELDRMIEQAMSSPAEMFALGGHFHDAPMLINGRPSSAEHGLIELFWLVKTGAPPSELRRLELYIDSAVRSHLVNVLRADAVRAVDEPAAQEPDDWSGE